MRVDIHTSLELPAAEWDDLVDRAGASPFLRPGWISAWWRAFGDGDLEVVSLRRDDRLAAVVALGRRGRRFAAPTNWHTPEFAFVAEDADARGELARALFERRPRSFRIGFLNADEPDVADLRSVASAARYRVLVRTLERSPYVRIDGDWDAYEAAREKHRIAEVRRRRRRLAEQGEVSFAIETGSDRLDEHLEAGFRIEGSGWKTESGTAIVSRPETRAFYTDVARWAAERGSLGLAFLRVGERPVAFFFLVIENGVIYHLKGGYDASFSKLAPGMLITYELLRHAFAHGMRRYEFLGDVEPFKLEWTTEVRDRLLFQAFNPSLVGTAEWAAFAHGRPLVKRALAAIGR